MAAYREKFGLMKYFWVNLTKVLSNLQLLTDEQIDKSAVDASVETALFYNGAGYASKDGRPTTDKYAKFICIETPYKTPSGKTLYGWAQKCMTKPIEGDRYGYYAPTWGTEEEFNEFIKENRSVRFSAIEIGPIELPDMESANKFVDELKNFLIDDEDWSCGVQSTFHYPILKSYLEHTLRRLIFEYDQLGEKRKLVFSANGKYVAFNTNLLSKFYNDVIIYGEANCCDDINMLKIYKPRIVKNGRRELFDLGFDIEGHRKMEDFIEPPCYFKDVSEVVFNATWIVDTDNEEKLEHTVLERSFRWPARYQDAPLHKKVKELKDGIEHAVIMARRNYKYIVPSYHARENKLQFLMPIFLEDDVRRPAAVIILSKHEEGQFYTPETALTFEQAYKDARLIVKPESSWLNPKYDQ
jgi:hypothetical protein